MISRNRELVTNKHKLARDLACVLMTRAAGEEEVKVCRRLEEESAYLNCR